MTVILASTSPTRQLLLTNAGVTFVTARPDVDEDRLRSANPQWRPDDVAPALAQAKAVAVSGLRPDALVLGADQTLICDHRLYAKPRDEADAREQLTALRGRTHILHSALCCARNGIAVWRHEARAELTMREWSPAFLDQYVAKLGADILTTVGGYKIEGLGLQLFSHISGDHSVILGLPLLPLLEFLRSEGEIAS
jgi:septum formation protein